MISYIYNKIYQWFNPITILDENSTNCPKEEDEEEKEEASIPIRKNNSPINIDKYNDVFPPVLSESEEDEDEDNKCNSCSTNLSPIPEELENSKFYYLALKRTHSGEKWSIHGLWPQTSLDSYPTFCRKVSFDIKKLNTILDDLHYDWYSTVEPDEYFWSHEWEKHGSCMFTEMEELDYFTKALDLYDYVVDNDIINDYINEETQINCQIPFDLDFNLIECY